MTHAGRDHCCLLLGLPGLRLPQPHAWPLAPGPAAQGEQRESATPGPGEHAGHLGRAWAMGAKGLWHHLRGREEGAGLGCPGESSVGRVEPAGWRRAAQAPVCRPPPLARPPPPISPASPPVLASLWA